MAPAGRSPPAHSCLSGRAHQPDRGTVSSGRERGRGTATAPQAVGQGLEEVLGTSALPAGLPSNSPGQPLSPTTLEVPCASMSSGPWSAPCSLRAPLPCSPHLLAPQSIRGVNVLEKYILSPCPVLVTENKLGAEAPLSVGTLPIRELIRTINMLGEGCQRGE